ncbi:uncharacterized protein UTRI_05970 [Ustilago trichophora]|uniref:Uncharacterized protein n=1 Tax=Ustilago trichophora TaxID=86804 RepID=A0A5C3EKV2_9BASI|nr:uncharacterized protein UTRI_05970 [Ustilago trichophora]
MPSLQPRRRAQGFYGNNGDGPHPPRGGPATLSSSQQTALLASTTSAKIQSSTGTIDLTTETSEDKVVGRSSDHLSSHQVRNPDNDARQSRSPTCRPRSPHPHCNANAHLADITPAPATFQLAHPVNCSHGLEAPTIAVNVTLNAAIRAAQAKEGNANQYCLRNNIIAVTYTPNLHISAPWGVVETRLGKMVWDKAIKYLNGEPTWYPVTTLSISKFRDAEREWIDTHFPHSMRLGATLEQWTDFTNKFCREWDIYLMHRCLFKEHCLEWTQRQLSTCNKALYGPDAPADPTIPWRGRRLQRNVPLKEALVYCLG